MKKTVQHLIALLLLAATFLPQNVFSQGIGIIDGESAECLEILESHVVVEVHNQIATITSTQIMMNPYDDSTSFKYAFPLNEHSNPVRLRWEVYDQWYQAEVSAENQNEDIPSGGGGSTDPYDIHPQLEEYLGNTSMYFELQDPLAGDSLVTFEIVYVELLPYKLGDVEFYMKRDISGFYNEPVPIQSLIYELHSEREISNIELENLAGTIDQETYYTSIQHVLVNDYFNDDYEVNYSLTTDELGMIPLSTMTPDSIYNCDDLGNGFCTMIIEPEMSDNTQIIAKNFTLIVDRSGSMSGTKIEQAKEASTFIVNNLNEDDKFNIITFSGGANSLFDSHVDVNTTNVSTALSFIESIGAGGGTNILDAITDGIDEFEIADPTLANIIIFITDGMGSNSNDAILNSIQNQINSLETSVFIYTIGIGTGTNEALLTLMADQNNGLSNFIGTNEVQDEISDFFLTINNPVLLNTQLTFNPPIIHDMNPYPLQNLYMGQQLIVSGRYDSAQTVNMNLSGTAYNLPVSYNFEIDLAASQQEEYSVLPKIWAKQYLDELEIEYFQTNDYSEQLAIDTLINDLSICYGVVDIEFTSFVDTGGTVEITENESEETNADVVVLSNPFTNELLFQILSGFSFPEDLQVDLYDINGRLIYSERILNYQKGDQIRIAGLENIPNGMYICTITSGSDVHSFKVLK